MTNYVSRGGDWNDRLSWDPNGTPGGGDTATIGSTTVTIGSYAVASKTTLGDSGTLIFKADGNLHSNLNASGTITVDSSSTAMIDGELTTSGSVTVNAKATLTVDGRFSSTSDIRLLAGSMLKFGEHAQSLTGNFSFQSSALVLARSMSFGGTYAPLQSTLTLSDSALNVVKASGAGVVFTNRGTIIGAGNMGDGTMSFVNGDGNTRGTIEATGDANALIFQLGAGELLRNANGLIKASGSAGLIVQAADPARGGGKLVNSSIIQAVNTSRIEISHVAAINKGASSTDKAVIEATNIATVVLDTANVKNTDGEIRASGGGTIKLTETDIDGGTLTLDGFRTALVTTGRNVLKDVDFNSTGTLFVQAGSLLNVTGAGNSSIAAATIGGRLMFGHDVTLQGKGKVALGGELSSSSTLTNVDEQITGTGTIRAGNLVNQKGASIAGGIDIDVESTVPGSGKLTNAGTISGGKVKAADVDNEGTISNVTFNVPYGSPGDHAIDNDARGVINSSIFGRTLVVNDGLIQADGAGQVTSFAGTKLHGGTLSSSNGGTIAVKAATDVTLLDPSKIAAGTTIALANGASVDLDGPASSTR